MMDQSITISPETFKLLQEVKKVFVSYTGESIEEFSDDKVIEILASGFFDSSEDEEHACGCGGDCSSKDDSKGQKEGGCGCGHNH